MKPIIYDITLIADKIGSQLQVNAKSGEHKSRRLRIQIVKDSRPFLPPIGATISLRGKHENGTMYLNTCALSAGRIVYDLGSNILATPGIVSCEVMIVDADSSVLYSPSFEIYVEDQLYTDEVVETEDEFTALTTALSRVQNIEASEAERVSAENARVAAETLRETAEDSRDAAEDDRAAAELERIAAEELRTSQENARDAAEDARIAAELTRNSQEAARESAEDYRESAEAARQAAEQNRASAESDRISSEQTRETQESARQSNTASAVQNANAAADRANSAAKSCEDIAGGNYPSHASTHASGGSDPITPASIGAAAADHTHSEYAASDHNHDSAYAAKTHTHDYAAANHTHTPDSLGAASSSHTHTPASIGAMGIGEANGAVGDMYTISIEPDVGSAGYSSIKIKDNATGNNRVEIATSDDVRVLESSRIDLTGGQDTGCTSLLYSENGSRGLFITDNDFNDRFSLYYDAPNDSCRFEILDASGNDITRQVIGAAPALSAPSGGTVNLTVADNTEYRFTSAVTSLTLTFPSGNFDCWLKFTTGSSITVTFPSGTKYVGGAPTFEAGKTYEMSIKDGSVICAEVTTE